MSLMQPAFHLADRPAIPVWLPFDVNLFLWRCGPCRVDRAQAPMHVIHGKPFISAVASARDWIEMERIHARLAPDPAPPAATLIFTAQRSIAPGSGIKRRAGLAALGRCRGSLSSGASPALRVVAVVSRRQRGPPCIGPQKKQTPAA
ncbi:hypothetical protein OK348_17005 [Flavobacterium sp. MXW15]|nr:hypothetical protein [Flavobacterium sp. MXW15]